MPNANKPVRFIGCTVASYTALGVYNEDTIYFLTDTQQIYLGNREYTKTIKILDAQPTASTVGENGRIYVYNGNMYMCQVNGYVYNWTRIANVNDKDGTVTEIRVGTGLTGDTITGSGTIAHAVPTGASIKSDNIANSSPDFGDTFQIAGVQTDEFGHVTAVNLHTVTLPTESSLAISSTNDTAETLASEGTFEVVTEISKGHGTHDISYKKKQFKLPISNAGTGGGGATYTFETGVTKPGSIKITPSDGAPFEVVIKDWDKISAGGSGEGPGFIYEGSVENTSNLPEGASIGQIHYVKNEGAYYIYLGSTEGWSEFNSAVDLTDYALKNETIPRVSGNAGQVPKFNTDGTISSTGFRLEKDVPANAVFTDTTYTHATHTAHGLGLYKVQIDGEGHVSNATQVQKSDIINLGIPEQNTDTKVKTTPNTTGTIYLAGADKNSETTGELQINPNVYVGSDGSMNATAFHGKADTATSADTATQATKAIKDGEGNIITDTYVTKEELGDSTVVWQVI